MQSIFLEIEDPMEIEEVEAMENSGETDYPQPSPETGYQTQLSESEPTTQNDDREKTSVTRGNKKKHTQNEGYSKKLRSHKE